MTMAAHCKKVRAAAVDCGVIVVPREICVPVLLRAEEIAHGESQLKKWIKEGMSATEIVKRGGYF